MDVIKREQLKNNFLKVIIIRLDFQNILDKDMIEILPIVKEYTKNYGFCRYEEKNSGDISVTVNENAFGSPNVTTDIVNEKRVYSFADDAGYTIELSDSFIVIKFVATKYISFEKHHKMLIDIINIIAEKSAFFTEKRFGVRKINKCLLKSKDLITQYFNSNVVDFYWNVGVEDTLLCKKLDIFAKENCLTNFNRSIMQGKSNGEVLYQVELDIDTYIQKTDLIRSVIYDKEKVLKLNNNIFEVYMSSLSDVLVEGLIAEEFTLPGVIGVEPNE